MATHVVTNGFEAYPQVQVVQQQPQPQNSRYQKAFIIGGISQMIIATLSIILGTAALIFYNNNIWDYHRAGVVGAGAGLWCSPFFIVSGILSVLTSNLPSNCRITGGLVMSVFSLTFAITMFSLEVSASVWSVLEMYGWHEQDPVLTTLHGILAFLSLVEISIAITQTVHCSKLVCSCCTTEQRNMAMQPNQVIVNQQAMARMVQTRNTSPQTVQIGYQTIQVPLYYNQATGQVVTQQTQVNYANQHPPLSNQSYPIQQQPPRPTQQQNLLPSASNNDGPPSYDNSTAK